MPNTTKFAKKTVKKTTQRRRQTNAEAAALDVVSMQPEKLRSLVSKAPQPGPDILLIYVGEGGAFFTFHTDLLPRATLAYILQQEMINRFYALRSEDPEVFAIYRNYLYTNKVFTISDEADDHLTDEANATWEWTRLAHCYILGKNIWDEKFANTCIDAIVEKIHEEDWYPTGVASEVYPHTREGDMLRKLIVDLHVLKGEGQWTKDPHGDANGPGEFLRDVIAGMAAMRGGEEEEVMPWEGAKCAYHTHELTAGCL